MSIKSIYRRHYCLFLATLLFALFFSMNSTAQIQVNLRPINPFHFTPEHSWEMDVISMKEKSFRVKVFAQISTKNHQLIADLESDALLINKGMNSFNSLTTQTQRINYSLADYGNLVSAIGKFPAGEYIVCLKFQCLTPDCDGAGSDAIFLEPNLCRDVKVELPTPLLLASPFDKSEIEEKRPMFTWIPPMPIGGMLELRYVYTLTEKREGQSNIDAIRRNRPIVQDRYVERPTLFYPLDIEELEYEKDYVWQVEAWYGNIYIATSEVWELKLKEEKEVPKSFKYIAFQDKPTGGALKTNFEDTLFFIYMETGKDINEVLFVYDKNRNIIPVIAYNINPDSTLNSDSESSDNTINSDSSKKNKYYILLSKAYFSVPGVYTIEIQLNKNRKKYFVFEIN